MNIYLTNFSTLCRKNWLQKHIQASHRSLRISEGQTLANLSEQLCSCLITLQSEHPGKIISAPPHSSKPLFFSIQKHHYSARTHIIQIVLLFFFLNKLLTNNRPFSYRIKGCCEHSTNAGSQSAIFKPPPLQADNKHTWLSSVYDNTCYQFPGENQAPSFHFHHSDLALLPERAGALGEQQ